MESGPIPVELNPITEWVGLKASSLLYQRDEAPIIGVTNGNLHADETIMLMNGMVANRHASPVIDEWFGVRYLDGECMGILPLEEVWRITGYRGNLIPGTTERRYVNRGFRGQLRTDRCGTTAVGGCGIARQEHAQRLR